MTKPKIHAYMTVQQPGTKKVAVCSRRIGSRDRLNVIALCNDETIAEKIVDALNALQEKMDQIDRPLAREIEQVKETLRKERELCESLRKSEREATSKAKNFEYMVNDLERQQLKLKGELDRALMANGVLTAQLGHNGEHKIEQPRKM